MSAIFLFHGYSLFFHPDLSRYNIPSSLKKDIEALKNHCLEISQKISDCKTIEELKVVRSRIREIKRENGIPYNAYAYVLGELWVYYYNKTHALIWKQESLRLPRPTPITIRSSLQKSG